MKVKIITNVKAEGLGLIEAGTVFESPLPDCMDAEFLNDTRICDILEGADEVPVVKKAAIGPKLARKPK